MEGITILAGVFFLLGFQFCSIHCFNCEIEESTSGKIASNYPESDKCWFISVPPGYFIHLKLKIVSEDSCGNGHVRIAVSGTNDEYSFCSSDKDNRVTAFGNVTVTQEVDRWEVEDTRVRRELVESSIELEYNVKTLRCVNENSFKCNDNFCISQEKVCDGMKDCQNGADEIGCEMGVLSLNGVAEARKKAVSWLKQQRTPLGWRENTPRAIAALYLATGASFNESAIEGELMAKETELKTAVALLRPTLTNSELSMFINALLVTCHSPRQFYGSNNLVQRLKDQVEESGNFTHPLAYLALCNANESWPIRATSDLINILNSTSEYPFVKDLQAMALMALSCEANNTKNFSNELNGTAETLYRNMIHHFINLQAPDGSFGNVYTTALITQALLSSGQEHNKDWNLNATIKYLIKQLNASSVDFLATYLTLPILNGKSLVDISDVSCSANPRKHGNDLISKINDYLGQKKRVQYSLYIGDEKDVVHTIFLRVPENYTAFEVMELAEIEDPKYKFERKITSGKMYVYEIANITNDPEAAKFWLYFVGSVNSSELTHFTYGPDKIGLDEGDHLVLWYKTASI